jgi:membrane-bound serine protease (ClpP class)
MAPQTNIGSATPIQLGGGEQNEVLGRKVRNDAAAYVRALAEGHGRDGDIAERMVRDAVNVTAARAERAGLVDIVAADERTLLRELDGFRVRGPKAGALDTSAVRLEQRDMPFQYEALQLLVNPTIAFMLLLVGLAGIAFEIFSPGAIAPGVLGGIALVLGLIGTALLPVTAAGVILLLAALAFFVAETQIASHGVLGLAGVLALVASGLLLFDTDSDVFEVSVPAAIAAGAMLGGFTLFAVSKALAARHGPVRTGWEELVGDVGTVRAPLDPLGQVFIEGALWRARAIGGGRLEPGERVRVDSVQGLTLNVRPAGRESEAAEEGE